jgi:hypothetical protein
LGTSVREIVDRLVFTVLVTVDEYPFLELQKKFNSGEVFRIIIENQRVNVHLVDHDLDDPISHLFKDTKPSPSNFRSPVGGLTVDLVVVVVVGVISPCHLTGKKTIF